MHAQVHCWQAMHDVIGEVRDLCTQSHILVSFTTFVKWRNKSGRCAAKTCKTSFMKSAAANSDDKDEYTVKYSISRINIWNPELCGLLANQQHTNGWTFCLLLISIYKYPSAIHTALVNKLLFITNGASCFPCVYGNSWRAVKRSSLWTKRKPGVFLRSNYPLDGLGEAIQQLSIWLHFLN